VQEYVKGGVLTEQRIDEIVTRIQKQEPRKAAAPDTVFAPGKPHRL
jgi:hypothetical protein